MFALLSVLVACQVGPTGAMESVHDPALGVFSGVTHRDLTLDFPLTGQPLDLRVSTSDAPGERPVILLSHGMGGSRTGLEPLAESWASHGFVVIRFTHPDSLSLATRGEQWEALRNRERSAAQRMQSPETARSAVVRPRQLQFVMDALADLPAELGFLEGKIDPERIGVSGHSFGAMTTMQIMGATFSGPFQERNTGDARPLAGIPISPQGPGIGGLTDTSYRSLDRPILFVTGSEDRDMIGGSGEARRQAFELAPAGQKWLLWLEGADHGFGGISGGRANQFAGDLRDRQMVDCIAATTARFWHAFLNEDEAARDRMERGVVPEVCRQDRSELIAG